MSVARFQHRSAYIGGLAGCSYFSYLFGREGGLWPLAFSILAALVAIAAYISTEVWGESLHDAVMVFIGGIEPDQEVLLRVRRIDGVGPR